jgi:hypothetical protein
MSRKCEIKLSRSYQNKNSVKSEKMVKKYLQEKKIQIPKKVEKTLKNVKRNKTKQKRAE